MSDEIVIGGDSADVPNGTYHATCVAWNVKTSDAYGDFRTWDFELSNGSVVGGATSLNTGKRSKGGKWIAALIGRVPTAGEAVRPIGLPCLVVVEEDANGWPKVQDVLPPMVVAAPAPAPMQGLPVAAAQYPTTATAEVPQTVLTNMVTELP